MMPKLNRATSEIEYLDRATWASGISIVAYGAHVGLRTNDERFLHQFLAQFPLTWTPAKTPRVAHLYSIITDRQRRKGISKSYLVYANAIELVRTVDLDEAFYAIELDMKFHLAANARRRVFVHAGVVGWKGKAIVIPGLCNTGKTTLVTELVRMGATYYSDEYAVFDEQGLVQPFPIRFNAREETGIHGLIYTAQSLGGKNGTELLPVGMIVVSEYKLGSHWQPNRLSTGQAILALMANTGTTRQKPVTTLAVLRLAASRAQALKGERGEAAEMVVPLLQQLRS